MLHIDLYRLSDAADLAPLGLRDEFVPGSLLLIEWPERAGSRLPEDRVPIDLDYLPDDPIRRILLAG